MHEVSVVGSAIQHAAETQSEIPKFHPKSSSKNKRKRLDPGTSSEWPSFAITDVTLDSQKPLTELLQPRRVLPRSNVPFAFLEFAREPDEDILPRLFFSSHEILDELEQEDAADNRLLVVERLADRCLAAVESVGGGFFTIRPLAGWLRLADIDSLPSKTAPYVKSAPLRVPLSTIPDEIPWWQLSSVPTGGKWPAEAEFKASAAANELLQDLVTRDPALNNHGENSHHDTLQQVGRQDSCDKDLLAHVSEAFDTIKLQYQEALYASEAPLAYFAKGPLSRARSNYCLGDRASSTVAQLTEHLKSLLLPMTVLDKKYQKSVPEVVKDLPFVSGHDDVTVDFLPSAKKPRKSKNTTIRKNGLYPNEDNHICSWWFGKVQKRAASELQLNREEFSRQCLNDLKAREMQLQIILLLEILALENSRPDARNKDSAGSPLSIESNPAPKSAKSKTVPDANTLLDLCIDRLSIWQTMTFENLDCLMESTNTSSRSISSSERKAQDRSNQLQDFCVDVVIPFYKSRMPDRTKAICRKLGNSQDSSPKHLGPAKSLHRRVESKTHSAPKRPAESRVRKTLERVLTDERPASRRPTPSLSRSATESCLPALKREVSELTISSVPSYHGPASQRYSQREVDLRKSSDVTEAKMKRKVHIDNELQSAIAALKRPNARAAVKEFVEAADKRTQSARSRKPLNPVRNPFAAQVMATPRKGQSVTGVGSARTLQKTGPPDTGNLIEPSTSASKVPCSVSKGPRPHGSLPAGPRLESRVAFEVEQTPTRGIARFVDREEKNPSVPIPSFGKSSAFTGSAQSSAAPQSPKLPHYPPRILRERQANAFKRADNPLEPPSEGPRCIERTPMKGQKILSFSKNALRVVTPPMSPIACLEPDEPDEVVDLL